MFLLFDVVLKPGEVPPQYVLTRFPQRDFWSPQQRAFVPDPTDAVMTMEAYPPGSPLDGVAIAFFASLPEPAPGELHAVKLIDPATGAPAGDPMTLVVDAPSPRVAVAVSLSVSR